MLFVINLEQAWQCYLQQNRRCALTGWPIVFSTGNKNNRSKQTASLDRIDNQCGYTVDNIQWVHKEANDLKGTLTMARLLEMCRAVVANADLK